MPAILNQSLQQPCLPPGDSSGHAVADTQAEKYPEKKLSLEAPN